MNSIYKKRLYNKRTKNIIFYIIIVACNVIFLGKRSNLLVSLPQFIFVIYFILRHDFRAALLYHIIFIITSISLTTALYYNDVSTVFSYSRLKLYGNLSLYQVVSFGLYLLIRNKYQIANRHILLYKFYKLVIYLGVIGISFGVMGLILGDYFFDAFVSYSTYIIILFLHLEMLLRCMNASLLRRSFQHSIYLLIAAPIATCVCFFILHMHTQYSGIDTIIRTQFDTLSIVLLTGGIYIKYNFLMLISFVSQCLNMTVISSGGQIIIYVAGLALFFVVLCTKNNDRNIIKRVNSIRVKILFLSILLIFFCVNIFSSTKISPLTIIKARQALSLLNIFKMISRPEAIHSIIRSPYIRVAEFLNIFDNGIHNPFFLLFGRGYGGYFTDSLCLFYDGINLGDGDYAAINIVMGKFSRPHSVYPATLLTGGVIGLFLVLTMGLKYAGRIKKNFLSFAAIPFLFTTFYFDSQIALTCIFLLFASEYRFRKNANTIH